MKNENIVKAELAEAFMHCVRANIAFGNGKFNTDKGEQSYEDFKKECYEKLLENNSAADLLKSIKLVLSELEIEDPAPQSRPHQITPNNQMPFCPLWDRFNTGFKPELKPWEDKFMYTGGLYSTPGMPKFHRVNYSEINGRPEMTDPRDDKTPIDDGGYPDNQMG